MSFSRRTFLRGTAGAIIALPFLEAMPQTAQAGVDATKRFVLFNRPWGTIPSHWIPDGVGADFRLKEILSPLEGLSSETQHIHAEQTRERPYWLSLALARAGGAALDAA